MIQERLKLDGLYVTNGGLILKAIQEPTQDARYWITAQMWMDLAGDLHEQVAGWHHYGDGAHVDNLPGLRIISEYVPAE